VPFLPVGDARGELDVCGGWTRELAHRYADRALDRLSPHVQGLKESVLAVDVITPVDLREYNVNAVAGDPYGGDSQLDQSYIWRPLPSSSGHQTEVPNLWHIGASTHPGAGLSGSSGHLVAQRLIASPGGAGRARAAVSRVMRRG
jgi:phytoene dehydrogenase-like protein